MKITVTWNAPIPLPGEARDLCDSFDVDVLPEEAGVYLFGRRFGPKLSVLYVGKAKVLRTRIGQQLNNNRLMRALDDAPIGERVLVYGTFNGKRGARIDKWLTTVEEALIAHFTEEEHALINKVGTRLEFDELEFGGSRIATSATGRTLRVPKRRRGLFD
ncbi:MAG TPA: hypothetical protein VF911_00955 [Thermoanaerobaculia bacterium]|jgi:hypothetical protein